MQQQLISLSPDLKKLQDEGYEIEVDGAYLFTRNLPYLNSDKHVLYGTLVSILTLATPTRAGSPQDHTIYFIGAVPCDAEGNALASIIYHSTKQQLTNTITVDHYFSSKPPSGNYQDFHEKISTYAKILGTQAQAIDPAVTWKPLKNKLNHV